MNPSHVIHIKMLGTIIYRGIKQNSEVLTFPQLELSLLLRRLLCCIRRIRLCAPFSVKLPRHIHPVKLFNYLIFWVQKRQFPFKASAVNLTASASIKAIITRHVTKAQKLSLKGSHRDPWGFHTLVRHQSPWKWSLKPPVSRLLFWFSCTE